VPKYVISIHGDADMLDKLVDIAEEILDNYVDGGGSWIICSNYQRMKEAEALELLKTVVDSVHDAVKSKELLGKLRKVELDIALSAIRMIDHIDDIREELDVYEAE